MVGFNSSEDNKRNFSKSDISYSGEIFMALNSCPSFYERLYEKAIYGPKLRIAMLASKVVKKAKNIFKFFAQKIFAKISSVLGFQHLFYNQKRNKSIDFDILLNNNMFGIEGIKQKKSKETIT